MEGRGHGMVPRHQEGKTPGRGAFLEDAGLDELGEELVHHLLLHGINAVRAEFDRRGTRLEGDVVFEGGTADVPVVVGPDVLVSAVPEHAVVETGRLVIREIRAGRKFYKEVSVGEQGGKGGRDTSIEQNRRSDHCLDDRDAIRVQVEEGPGR